MLVCFSLPLLPDVHPLWPLFSPCPSVSGFHHTGAEKNIFISKADFFCLVLFLCFSLWEFSDLLSRFCVSDCATVCMSLDACVCVCVRVWCWHLPLESTWPAGCSDAVAPVTPVRRPQSRPKLAGLWTPILMSTTSTEFNTGSWLYQRSPARCATSSHPTEVSSALRGRAENWSAASAIGQISDASSRRSRLAFDHHVFYFLWWTETVLWKSPKLAKPASSNWRSPIFCACARIQRGGVNG